MLLVFAEGRGLGKENSHNICLLVFVLCNLCISILHFQMKHVILMLLWHNCFFREHTTQTPPESISQNRIAALIAQRHDVIVRKAQKEEREF